MALLWLLPSGLCPSSAGFSWEWSRGGESLPSDSGYTSFDIDQDMVAFLGCKCTLLSHAVFLISEHFQVLLFRAALNSLFALPVNVLRTTLIQVLLALLNIMRLCWDYIYMRLPTLKGYNSPQISTRTLSSWLQLCELSGNSLSTLDKLFGRICPSVKSMSLQFREKKCCLRQCQMFCINPEIWLQFLFLHQCCNSVLEGHQIC